MKTPITFSIGELNEIIVAVEDAMERYTEGIDLNPMFKEDYMSYIEYLKIAHGKLKAMYNEATEKLWKE